jgi:hypothetical protein
MNLRLITFKLRSTPKAGCVEEKLLYPSETLVTYGSQLPIDEALTKVVSYQRIWNEQSTIYELSHTLVSIQDIPGEAYLMLGELNVEFIEDLPNNPDELDF